MGNLHFLNYHGVRGIKRVPIRPPLLHETLDWYKATFETVILDFWGVLSADWVSLLRDEELNSYFREET